MKKLILFLALCASVFADIPQPVTVDFAATYAPALEVYQANQKTWQWTFKMDGATANLTGYTPFMYWAVNSGASSMVTSYAWLVTATAGIANARFLPADLNTNGTFIYGVGITTGNVTVARQGVLTIKADPYATGAGAVTFSTNLNASLYNWTGTIGSPSCVILGDGSGLTGVGAAQTSGLASISMLVNSTVVARVKATNDAIVYVEGLGYVTQTVTNGLASIGYVGAQGFVTQTVTNGLASIGYVGAQGYVTGTVTNGLASIGQLNDTSTVLRAYADAVNNASGVTDRAYADAQVAATGTLIRALIPTVGTIAPSNATDYIHAGRTGEFYHADNPAGYLSTESDPVFSAASNDYLRLAWTNLGYMTQLYLGTETAEILPSGAPVLWAGGGSQFGAAGAGPVITVTSGDASSDAIQAYGDIHIDNYGPPGNVGYHTLYVNGVDVYTQTVINAAANAATSNDIPVQIAALGLTNLYPGPNGVVTVKTNGVIYVGSSGGGGSFTQNWAGANGLTNAGIMEIVAESNLYLRADGPLTNRIGIVSPMVFEMGSILRWAGSGWTTDVQVLTNRLYINATREAITTTNYIQLDP